MEDGLSFCGLLRISELYLITIIHIDVTYSMVRNRRTWVVFVKNYEGSHFEKLMLKEEHITIGKMPKINHSSATSIALVFAKLSIFSKNRV